MLNNICLHKPENSINVLQISKIRHRQSL